MKKPYELKIEKSPPELCLYIGHQSFTIEVFHDPDDGPLTRRLKWYKAQLTTALDRLCAEAAATSKAREEGYLKVLQEIKKMPHTTPAYVFREMATVGIARVDGTAAKAVDEIVRTLEGMDDDRAIEDKADEDRYVRNFWIGISIFAAALALWGVS